MELDLGSVKPSLAGPKRPHDHILLEDMKNDFNKCLTAPRGFKGFGLKNDQLKNSVSIKYNDKL